MRTGSRILDLGCGNGVPVADELAADFAFVGYDISEVQVARARRTVPRAQFHRADMTALTLPAHSVDAVIVLYAIIHVPLAEQPELLRRIAMWLRPGGCLLAVVGHAAWTGTEENWLNVDGATMYWSHADNDTYERWLTDLGFQILRREFVPEDDSGHVMLLAMKHDAPPARTR